MKKYNTSGRRASRYIDWPQYDNMLGKASDGEIAKLIGCTDTGVRNRREKLGIAPKFKTHWTIEQKEEHDMLHGQGLRRCARCSEIKPHSGYDKNNHAYHNGKAGFSRRCKPCKAIYQAARIEERRRYWLDIAGASCCNCGWDTYRVSLDFHHVNGDDKEWGPSKLIMSRPLGSEDVYRELDKCVVLCCNCHQAIHRGALVLEFKKCDGLGWKVVK